MADLQKLKVRGRSNCNVVYAKEFVGGLTGVADIAIYDIEGNPIVGNYLNKKNFISVGNSKQPVYFDSEGIPHPIEYSLEVAIPEDAKFTDTVTSITVGGNGNAITDIIDKGEGQLSALREKTFLTEHPEIANSIDQTTVVRPANGSSFETIASIVKDDNGHITQLTKQKVVLPAIAWTDEKVTQSFINTTEFKPILFGTAGDNDYTGEVYKNSTIYVSPQLGEIYANNFIGDLNGTALRTYNDENGKNISKTYAPIDSPVFTGIPTVPTPTVGNSSNQIATTQFVQDVANTVLTAGDAMVFKGTIGSSGTVSELPTNANVGWTYKAIEDGMFANQKCEIGDLIIYLGNSQWTVVQSNIDGSVTNTEPSVNNNIAVFNGESGRVIKDSGFTIQTSVPQGALFTDTRNTVGATQTAEIIYLVGTLEQGESVVSYTNKSVYVEDGVLFTNGEQVATKVDIAQASGDISQVEQRVEQIENELPTLLGDKVDRTVVEDITNTLNNKVDRSNSLAGYGISDAYNKGEIDEKLSAKADSATTLEGYGIADAYTQEQTNTLLSSYVKSVNGVLPIEGNVTIESITNKEIDKIIGLV